MTLQDIIESISGWREKTAPEIIAALRAPTIDHAETEWFTGYGLALIIGEDAVQPFADRIRAMGKGWIADSIGGRGMPIGDPVFNQKLIDTGDVDAIKIAMYGRRKISILEHYKSEATNEEISAMHELAKVLALRREGRAEIAVQYSICFDAYGRWDGNPNTRPKLCP